MESAGGFLYSLVLLWFDISSLDYFFLGLGLDENRSSKPKGKERKIEEGKEREKLFGCHEYPSGHDREVLFICLFIPCPSFIINSASKQE